MWGLLFVGMCSGALSYCVCMEGNYCDVNITACEGSSIGYCVWREATEMWELLSAERGSGGYCVYVEGSYRDVEVAVCGERCVCVRACV